MIEYVKDETLQGALDDILSDGELREFANLRDNKVVIACCLKVKTNKDGEDEASPGEVVQLKKVSALHKVFIDAHYLMVVDNYGWNNANSEIKQKAMIHKALMRIDVEEDGGNLKFKARQPDVVEFRATVLRYGTYNESLLDMREAFKLSVPKLDLGIKKA